MKNPEFYTEAELVTFGEYLLSDERRLRFVGQSPAELLKMVHDADIENWKTKVGGAGVEMGEETKGLIAMTEDQFREIVIKGVRQALNADNAVPAWA